MLKMLKVGPVGNWAEIQFLEGPNEFGQNAK